jgi:hypothetical protein
MIKLSILVKLAVPTDASLIAKITVKLIARPTASLAAWIYAKIPFSLLRNRTRRKTYPAIVLV